MSDPRIATAAAEFGAGLDLASGFARIGELTCVIAH
jgi:hypothetical protein